MEPGRKVKGKMRMSSTILPSGEALDTVSSRGNRRAQWGAVDNFSDKFFSTGECVIGLRFGERKGECKVKGER